MLRYGTAGDSCRWNIGKVQQRWHDDIVQRFNQGIVNADIDMELFKEAAIK